MFVKKIQQITLNFYAARSQDGKWLNSRIRVNEIAKAKIYTTVGPAKSLITWWANNHPEYGIPDLVKITVAKCEFLDQKERVKDANLKITLKKTKSKVLAMKNQIKTLIKNYNIDNDLVEKLSKDLIKAEMELKQLQNI